MKKRLTSLKKINQEMAKIKQPLEELKQNIPSQLWKFFIINEFISLFSNNIEVLHFACKDYLHSLNIIDERITLSERALKLYEEGKIEKIPELEEREIFNNLAQ